MQKKGLVPISFSQQPTCYHLNQDDESAITTFRSKFFVSVPKNIDGEHFGVSENFEYRKILRIRERGVSRFSVENFLSHSTEKFRWGTLLCFERILVSKIFKQRRGEASRFFRKFLSNRTKTKSFVKEPFCFPENFWYRKVLWMKRGGITFFRRKFLVSQCRKNSWASLQCFRKFGVSKNFMHNRGYHKFSSKIFCLSAEKFGR